MSYLLKVITALALVIAITEATKRFGFIGALLAALPLISVVWIYHDTGDVIKIAAFSMQVFWLVLPSLGLFLSLPLLLKRFSFYPSLAMASLVTIVLYLLMLGLFRLMKYKIAL